MINIIPANVCAVSMLFGQWAVGRDGWGQGWLGAGMAVGRDGWGQGWLGAARVLGRLALWGR